MKRRIHPILTSLFACLLVLLLSSFQSNTSIRSSTISVDDEDIDKNTLVTLISDEFNRYTNRVYRQLTYAKGQDTINEDVLALALKGYTYLKQTDALQDDQYLSVVDFGKKSTEKRLWIIDMCTKTVVFNEWVAHGAKTGDLEARYFSNKHSSHKSSLGFYTTGGIYYGRNNLSLKLNGLEKGFNSNAYSRGIVIHGANYVSKEIATNTDRLGRSYGCPAVSQAVNKKLVNTIKGGNCLFIYHPTEYYLQKSKIVNANLYIPVEELSS